jgi:DNA-binding NarL/FixJ family response regulator
MTGQTNMDEFQNDHDAITSEPRYKRSKGVLLDEKQWLFLKNKYLLTPRELQVAILVCRGFNNNEISRELKIKQGTVKTYLRNIYRRVKVKNKIHLLLRFLEDVG